MRAPNLVSHSGDDIDAGGLEELAAFLSSARVAPGCFRLPELDGLLAALALSPRAVAPEEWLGRIWGELEPRFESTEEAQRLIHVMRARHDQVRRQLHEEPSAYRPVFRTVDDGAEVAAEWARGFLAGTGLCPEGWEPLVRGAQSRVLLMPIYAQLSEYDGVWSAEVRDDLARLRRQAPEMIPQVVAAIADFWREQRDQAVDRSQAAAGRQPRG
jgi:uncharacterized protein